MSASLFADMYIDYGESPANYIEYNEGEKTFGELKKGDIIYLYSSSLDDILEITINGSLNSRKGKVTIRTKPFKVDPNNKYCIPQSSIEFGPNSSSAFGNGHAYHPEKVKDCSICASWKGRWAVGTNRETILKYAKLDIINFINEKQNNIKNLQKEIEILTNKLEALKVFKEKKEEQQ